MKRILVYFFIIQFSISLSFAQEEVWGYHSLAGSEGGGMIFKVDPDSKDVETIQRFEHANMHGNIPGNKVFMSDGNGKIYGYTEDHDYITKELYSFDPITKELDFLVDLENGVCLSAIDSNFIYLTSSAIGYSSYVYAYDISMDTIGRIMVITEEQGYNIQGSWMKYSDGVYYTFMGNGGLYQKGTVLELDVINREVSIIVNFENDWYPKGSLITGPDQHIYGAMSKGKTNKWGSIISIDPKKKEEYNVHAIFIDSTGGVPFGEMFLADDGCFYGVTNAKGEFYNGTFYKFNPQDNSLESIYEVNDDSEEFYRHGFLGYFSRLSENKLIGILENKVVSVAGKIFSFDLISHELEILYEFDESNISSPVGQLMLFDNQYFGIYKKDTTHLDGGIFSFNTQDLQIALEKKFHIHTSAQEGQNPKWICQGENGNIYGMTHYGGKENKGIVFEINYFSKEFTKKMDVADIGVPLSPRPECFSMSSEVIVGLSRAYISTDNDMSKSGYVNSMFEYNYKNNSFSELLIFPDSLYRNSGLRMNAEGSLYFSRENNLSEYDFINNEIKTTVFPDSLVIIDIVEYTPNTYVGSSMLGGSSSGKYTYGMLFSWNKNTNEIVREFDMHRLSPSGGWPASPRNRLFCTKGGVVYGDFISNEVSKPSWIEPFVFDLENDSLLYIHPLYIDFDDHKTNSVMETNESSYLIQNIVLDESDIGGLKIYESSGDITNIIELEDSPYHYVYESGNSFDSNIPCRYYIGVDIISIKKPDGGYFWTGDQNTAWHQEKNWYGNKQPSDLANVVILSDRPNFPILDTMVSVGNITIQNQASIKLNPDASLSCQSILNEGELKLYANDTTRASLISRDSIINKGSISYSFIASNSGCIVLGSPIKNVKLEDLDSIPVWEFDGYDWISIQNPSSVLTPLQGYSFALDSTQELKFSGDLNNGNISYNFLSNSNMLEVMANPYPSSFDWRKLDLSHMDDQALYKFNASDSTFTYYIDGLGNASPLVQPLEAFIINSNGSMQFELDNSQRIHAVNFKDDSTYTKNKLTIKAEGKDGGDQTQISFNHLATSGFDKNYDAHKFLVANKARPQIFTFAGDEILSINQLPDTAMMDLAIQAGQGANFTISIEKNLGFEFVVLEDLIWKEKTDLLKQDYRFDYLLSDSVYPFKLYFKPWAIQPVNESDIEIYYYPESIVVRSRKQIDFAYISFYDLAGRVVLELQAEEFHHFEKPISLPVGHYIVQVRTGDLVVNRKVLVRR